MLTASVFGNSDVFSNSLHLLLCLHFLHYERQFVFKSPLCLYFYLSALTFPSSNLTGP